MYIVRAHRGFSATVLEQFEDAVVDRDVHVAVIAVMSRREDVADTLSGWRDAMRGRQSLDWVEQRLAESAD